MRFKISVFLFLAFAFRNEQSCEGTSCSTAKLQETIERDTKVRMFHLTANIKKLRRDLEKLKQFSNNQNSLRGTADELQESPMTQEQLAQKTQQLSSLTRANEAIFDEISREMDQARKQIGGLSRTIKSIRNICLGNATVDCPSDITGADCSDILRKGGRHSGVYFIEPTPDSIPVLVFCDQESGGGGWTYIHSRVSNELDFNRSWLSYKHGFGEVNCNGGGNFWIGNEAIHRLTTLRHYHLRVDLSDWSGNIGYATYTTFEVGPEESEYKLYVSGYVDAENVKMRIQDGFSGYNFGHINDEFYTSHDGMNFSTFDRDNDLYQYECAHQDGGGWWFNRCSAVNLNGRIYRNGFYRATDTLYGFDNAMIWGPWTGLWYSLKTSSMKIRPAAFTD